MTAQNMKRFLLFISLFLLAPSLMAQKIGGGLIVGPVLSTMNINGNDSTQFRVDFTAGVRIALIPQRSIIGGEIDIIYSRQGTSSKKGLNADENDIRYLEKSHYINMPLLLTVYFRKWNEDDEDESMIPRLRIGPQIGFCVGGNSVCEVKSKPTKQYITPWDKGSFNRFDYGVTAAISYWFIEVRYTFGMANVFKEGEKSTNHVISVTWSDVW